MLLTSELLTPFRGGQVIIKNRYGHFHCGVANATVSPYQLIVNFTWAYVWQETGWVPYAFPHNQISVLHAGYIIKESTESNCQLISQDASSTITFLTFEHTNSLS